MNNSRKLSLPVNCNHQLADAQNRVPIHFEFKTTTAQRQHDCYHIHVLFAKEIYRLNVFTETVTKTAHTINHGMHIISHTVKTLKPNVQQSIVGYQPKTAVGLFILRLKSAYVRSYQRREVAHLVWRRGTRGRRRRGAHCCTRLLGFQLGVHQQLLEIIHALVQLLHIRLQQHNKSTAHLAVQCMPGWVKGHRPSATTREPVRLQRRNKVQQMILTFKICRVPHSNMCKHRADSVFVVMLQTSTFHCRPLALLAVDCWRSWILGLLSSRDPTISWLVRA